MAEPVNIPVEEISNIFSFPISCGQTVTLKYITLNTFFKPSLAGVMKSVPFS